MPNRARHTCRPGCPNLVPAGQRWCDACTKAKPQQLDDRRGSSHARGYGVDWQRRREAWLQAHPLCGDRLDGPSAIDSLCVQRGRVMGANVVDHIRRKGAGGEDDESNFQSLCDRCHNVKRQREGRGER